MSRGKPKANRKSRARKTQPPDAVDESSRRADLGVLFVHGIGKQRPGETLEDFGKPIADFIARRLPASSSADAVSEFPCPGCPGLGRHRHLLLKGATDVGVASRHWIFAECYWDDLVTSVDARAYNEWLSDSAPMLVLWQMASSGMAGLNRMRQGWRAVNPFAWMAWLSALLIGIFARMLFTLMTPLFSAVLQHPGNDGKLGRTAQFFKRVVEDTLGDAHAFATPGDGSDALANRMWARYSALDALAQQVAVVGHSQGAALAHRALLSHGAAPALFAGVGSGLGILSAAVPALPKKFAKPRRSLSAALAVLTWFFLGGGVYVLLVLLSQLALTLLLLVSIVAFGLVLMAIAMLRQNYVPTALFEEASQLHRDAVLVSSLLPNAIRQWRDVLIELSVQLLVTMIVSLVLMLIIQTVYPFPKIMSLKELRIPGLKKERWLEFYSPLDPVSSGTEANTLATRIRVSNATGWNFLREHVAYFDPPSRTVAGLSERLAQIGKVHFVAMPWNADPISMRLRMKMLDWWPLIAWLALFFTVILPTQLS